ncbi:IS30 family transposase [Blastococcus montanus]|uniref:IS30 family transposase n=1 Tax=Blastococcus montanus TaxID=3144973 RepID=UPI00320ADA6A
MSPGVGVAVTREKERRFWRAVVRRGASTAAAAAEARVDQVVARRWFRECGGVAPVDLSEPSGRLLSLSEREEISRGLAAGCSQAEIARRIGRDRSTISRELRRNRPPGRKPYRAVHAQRAAEARARRPKRRKLEHEPLRVAVQADLSRKWSPEEIAARLRRRFPDDEAMEASHETIYRALYVQGRGELRRELASCLRTGRAIRKPRKRVDGRADPDRRIPDKVMISERPAEVADRAVPGHWEGDLILGKNNRSAIGTLVERSTRFCMLLHLPGGPGDPIAVRDQIVATIGTLPAFLRRSLTWDQGLEMRRHTEIILAADLPVYFCDPRSPWQRGTNENTNGLLRQYFPKGTDLSVHDPEALTFVANELNGRPRKTLGWDTPAEAMAALLSSDQSTGVATTP